MTMDDRAGSFELDSEDSWVSTVSMWTMFSALILIQDVVAVPRLRI
jgi:hypothetical protein